MRDLCREFMHTRRPPPEELIMVVHGPGAFDSGDVARSLALLSPSRIIVAGVMGRCAAEESGISCEYPGEPPSAVISSLPESTPVFLLNRGKTAESGTIFGEIVASHLHRERGLVHVEAAAEKVLVWNGGDEKCAAFIADRLGFSPEHRSASPLSGEGERTIRGCLRGEPVFVNGVVIGTATEETVTLREREGRVQPTAGLLEKPHGLEKLHAKGPVHLKSAWCKSGIIRDAHPITLRRNPEKKGRIVVVDHAGAGLYDRLDGETCGILAIGDDTTAVCGHICTHLAIPVFGVTDGDADSIVEGFYPTGSVVVLCTKGRDDEIGRKVAVWAEGIANWDDWVKKTLLCLDGQAEVVVDRR